MIKKVIEIIANTSQAEKSIEGLNDDLKKTDELAEKAGKSTSKAGNDSAKGFKEASKSSRLLSKGFKLMGTALKATGIGLLVGLLAKLAEAFMKNQKVVDTFNTVFEFVSIAMTDFVNFLMDNTGGVVDFFKAIFENPKKALMDFADAFKRNIQERFESYLDTLGFIASAVKKVFSGDFKGALEDVKKAGKESIDVLTGVNNSFDKGKKFIEDAAEATANYVKETFDAAKSNVEVAKNAELAAVAIQGVIEKYDREAEVLRQVRDDTSKSVAERIAANEELGRVLEKQIKEEQKLINVQLAAARARAKGNEDNVEFRKEIIALENELAGVTAKVTGLQSEQLTNRNALLQEQIDFRKELMQIGKDERDRAIQDAQDILDERKRLIEREIQDDAEKKQLLLKAEQDYRDALFEIDNAEEIAKAEAEAKRIEDEQLSFEHRLEMIKSQEQQVLENEKLTEEQRTKLAKQFADARVKITELETQAKEAQLASYANALSQFSDIAGKETAAGKALAVAATLINTYQGASQALTDETIPNTFAKIAAAATVIATGIANVKSIMSVKVPNQAGGVGGNVAQQGARGGQNQPAFNLVGRSNVNQLQTGLEQQETAPVKAFVVSTNVTTQQEADRATESQAAFG